MTFYDNLTTETWDYALINVRNAQPIFIERKGTKVQIWDRHLDIHLANGPHPIDKDRTASSIHSVTLTEITGISYFKENKVVVPTLAEQANVVKLNP